MSKEKTATKPGTAIIVGARKVHVLKGSSELSSCYMVGYY